MGKFKDNVENYDLITIIILNIGEKSTSRKLLNLLHLLFMELKTSEEKEKILHEDYEIKITRDMKEELSKMGGLMEPLLNIAAKQAAKQAAEQAKREAKKEAEREAEQARAEDEKESQINAIRNMVKKMNLMVQEAMNILEIPLDRRKEYISLI